MSLRLALRRVLTLAAVSAVLAPASACGGGSRRPASDAPPPATFANSYLSFRHPAAWTAYPFRWSGELHFRPMLYLSTQPVRNPCRTRDETVSCTWPVDRLRPAGVLVQLENRGFPGWSLAEAPGTELRVGGRPAKRQIDSDGACRTIGGDVTIEVAVASPMPDNWTELTACLRGPQLGPNERQLEALLTSLRFR